MIQLLNRSINEFEYNRHLIYRGWINQTIFFNVKVYLLRNQEKSAIKRCQHKIELPTEKKWKMHGFSTVTIM